MAVPIGSDGRQRVIRPLRSVWWVRVGGAVGRFDRFLRKTRPVSRVGVSRDVLSVGFLVERDADGEKSICWEVWPHGRLGALMRVEF